MARRYIHPALTLVILGLTGSSALAQPAAPLAPGVVSATLTVEADASRGVFGDVVSLAPDIGIGVTDDLTLALIHSTFGRTGFRGSAGAGVCVTDACPSTYDNVGIEALYALTRGDLTISANPGLHAWSFDRDFYVAKLGMRLRYKVGRVTWQTLPAVTLALTERDGLMPNRDRAWVPLTASVAIAGGLSLGAGTGVKGAFADVEGTYEVAAGVFATYAHSAALSFGASWIHGKLLAGAVARPDDVSGIDSRALHVWVTATH